MMNNEATKPALLDASRDHRRDPGYPMTTVYVNALAALTPRSQAWGVNRITSTRLAGAPATAPPRGTCEPNPTEATFRLLNQPDESILCRVIRYLRTESACSWVRIWARSASWPSSVK